jgi:hypothetical protein
MNLYYIYTCLYDNWTEQLYQQKKNKRLSCRDKCLVNDSYITYPLKTTSVLVRLLVEIIVIII